MRIRIHSLARVAARLALFVPLALALACAAPGPSGQGAQATAAARPLREPDVRYEPTPQPVVREMLRLAGVGPGDLVYDLGSGDGRIPITAAREFGAQGVGIDRSAEALTVASANAALWGLGARAQLLLRDWDEPGWAADLGRFDLVLANPPYVEDAAPLEPDVRRWEPAGALFAGAEGLDAYRALVPQLPRLLTESGVAVLEIGAAQAEQVSDIAAQFGFACALRRDLGDRPRALVLRLGLGK